MAKVHIVRIRADGKLAKPGSLKTASKGDYVFFESSTTFTVLFGKERPFAGRKFTEMRPVAGPLLVSLVGRKYTCTVTPDHGGSPGVEKWP